MKHTVSSEKIAMALKQEELGMPVADIVGALGVSEETFYVWKKQIGAHPEYVQELRSLQEENRRLKQLIAELTLETSRLKQEGPHK